MGITGLIPFLEKSSSRINVQDLRGSCIAIDSYCWLHKGSFACSDKIVTGQTTDLYVIYFIIISQLIFIFSFSKQLNRHIQYCLKYVRMLLSFEIKPILVFDGRHLPAKAMTEKKRRM